MHEAPRSRGVGRSPNGVANAFNGGGGPCLTWIMLIAAQVFSFVGMGWLALALALSLDAHWTQVFGTRPRLAATHGLLRVPGAAAIANSLIASFWADHPSMAPLVWVMSLAVSALAIAMLLAWRPGWMNMLILPAKANS